MKCERCGLGAGGGGAGGAAVVEGAFRRFRRRLEFDVASSAVGAASAPGRYDFEERGMRRREGGRTRDEPTGRRKGVDGETG